MGNNPITTQRKKLNKNITKLKNCSNIILKYFFVLKLEKVVLFFCILFGSLKKLY